MHVSSGTIGLLKMTVSLTTTPHTPCDALNKCHNKRTQLRNASAPNWADIVGSYLRSRWGRGCCCWRVMKVVPHTGLLWLFLSQPTGGEDGYGVLRNPWSDSVSAVRDEAELPITTVRSQQVSENTPVGTFVATETEKRSTLLEEKQADL